VDTSWGRGGGRDGTQSTVCRKRGGEGSRRWMNVSGRDCLGMRPLDHSQGRCWPQHGRAPGGLAAASTDGDLPAILHFACLPRLSGARYPSTRTCFELQCLRRLVTWGVRIISGSAAMASWQPASWQTGDHRAVRGWLGCSGSMGRISDGTEHGGAAMQYGQVRYVSKGMRITGVVEL